MCTNQPRPESQLPPGKLTFDERRVVLQISFGLAVVKGSKGERPWSPFTRGGLVQDLVLTLQGYLAHKKAPTPLGPP